MHDNISMNVVQRDVTRGHVFEHSVNLREFGDLFAIQIN